MDAYMRLNWSKQNRRSEQRLLEQFAIDFSRYEEDIFNLHINEIDPIHQLGDVYDDDQTPLQYPIDPRTGLEMRRLVIDTTKPFRMFEQFPTGSKLGRAEHQHCLTVLNRLNLRLGFDSPEEKEALGKYKTLMKKLGKEQCLFDSFVKKYFNTHLVGRKKIIDHELNQLVIAIWKSKVQRMLQGISDSKFYLSTAVMWMKYGVNEQNVTFELASENVLELGVVKNIFTENLLHCNTLKRNKRILDQFCSDEAHFVSVDDALQIETILRQDESIRFVISSGALNYLLNSATNLQQRWMIPIQIRTIGDRNVIIFGKKLQPTKMLSHDRNIKAHKYLVRSFMTITKKVRENNAKESKPVTTPEYIPVHFDEYLHSLQKRRQSMPQSEQNVRLGLWKLSDGDNQCKFLVRSRMDCYESLRKMKFYINISIKLEYQAEFGAEQMTSSELLREWIRQFLRPNSKTLRLRIDALTHAILSHHYLELKDIEEELKRKYNIEPMNLFTNLWQTLKLLLNFPPGEHLMQHDIKNPETVMILTRDPKALNASSSIDLNDIYNNVEYEQCALEEYEWVPIDRTVITKMHREHTLLPCTFPHWHNVQRIVRREKIEPKRPPPPPKVEGKPKKKKSKGNRVRRKQKLREKKIQQQKQQAIVSQLQQSLDQFAPYEGPVRTSKTNVVPSPMSATKPASPSTNLTKKETFDYQSYVNQANIN
ncbi:uncharacterized protein LOC129764845 [Toxorhynchites rutilus septentrionalis]|uniref:uncharacterized protein LOC129764845 n=1 Tax=Toxorhynchites rutilus septentrionalis TaxID=329112 RepID=UPI00247A64A8|nr:uncharacterized protein LOC129764845 [Toxorhynchites rutilus septentrionalis]